MKISTILDHIDSGHMALPEFQRGYVWNGDQVRGLFDSMYKRHPVGGLLVWATESMGATHRGDGTLAPGIVKLLLDGQQRMTSLYGVIRGKPPKFFDGKAKAFTGLQFNLDTQTFEFYQPAKMKDHPLWVDVSELMKGGTDGLGVYIAKLSTPELAPKLGDYVARLSRVLGIADIDLHIEEVTGADKSLDVVVDIFNRVNSGGTKLSKGDLALAKICADWPTGRDEMKNKLKEWHGNGYDFSLDWLLRSVNTVLTGEAKFLYLHEQGPAEVQDALRRACKQIDVGLNMIADRLGLDHDRVLFSRGGFPVMARYLDQRQQKKLGPPNEKERDKLLFWYFQSGMWGRFSGSVESYIDKDLEAIESDDLDTLLEQLRLWHGGLRAEAAHFTGWSLGARFYPVLYMLTRVGEARDWGSGIGLKANMHGKMSKLEVHHIFPKAQLYKRNSKKSEVNALANYCFLTKDTNLDISDTLPEIYFPKIEAAHPGALASQWIPMDPELWKIENYRDFMEARKILLASELNKRLESLLHGDTKWMSGAAAPIVDNAVGSGVESEAEEAELEALNDWVVEQGLPRGTIDYDYADAQTGEQIAVFDLAWPTGLQEELSQPVVVLLNEEAAVITLASQAGYQCFTDTASFRRYVRTDVLSETADAA
ncbi:GmrSD restriction endonuclease domain-containing protein [Pseudoxanthomonas daejeonensis]|uniref:GmrSD restriction endonucleases N-terminal domain-containing protein n=1 Tax=Pseudoxanthomonas daejeonensis TaxID=266062 RepID=A0ABQ6Z444_9GAMM|nr:DUF262 domain-containing protein [Pseudoxanthomonas daejeonensis]KAF1691719.1 hypothetical protein CSC65_15810 [Pseudoxanthomonas daejeonensis]